jgi:hypothetical protein
LHASDEEGPGDLSRGRPLDHLRYSHGAAPDAGGPFSYFIELEGDVRVARHNLETPTAVGRCHVQQTSGAARSKITAAREASEG